MNNVVTLAGEYDVVVLGAGAAGMTAAFVAAKQGLSVLLVEKSTHIGGSTSRAAGTAWIPGNFTMNAATASVDVKMARQYLDKLVGERSDALLRDQFLEIGPRMLDFMQQNSAVRFQACPKHTDYYPDLPGAKPGGRPVEAIVYDGRRLDNYFDMVQPPPPEFMVFGGMMVSKADIDKLLNARRRITDFRHATYLISRYTFDRLRGYARGTRLTMGNALCGRLLRSVVDAGVTLQLSCQTTEIKLSADHSYSLAMQTTHGSAKISQAVLTAKTIIFAGGGYSANKLWRERYMPRPTPNHTAASDDNDASTLTLALSLGAMLGESCDHNAWWFPASVVPRKAGSSGSSDGVFPHIVLDRAKPGIIAVDRHGQRFVNEGVNYHEFSLAQYRSNAVPCWLVCDATFIRRYGLGAVRPGGRRLDRWVCNGYLKRAATLDALSDQIGVDTNGLLHTTEKMARFAQTGEDIDFGKGKDLVSSQNGDALNTPNPCLGAIKTAPFFAVEVSPADLGTSLGLRTNKNAQLVDSQGKTLKGLYACGNDMNSIMGGQYPAPGVSIGPGMTFGYIAALHAAKMIGPGSQG